MVTHPLWRPFAPQVNAERQTARVARRQTAPGPPRQHDDRWRGQYVEVRDLIMAVLADLVLAVGHVGSTAVPGLVAKPVIDIDLTIADAEDEASSVPRLQTVGFRLVFRDDLGGAGPRGPLARQSGVWRRESRSARQRSGQPAATQPACG